MAEGGISLTRYRPEIGSIFLLGESENRWMISVARPAVAGAGGPRRRAALHRIKILKNTFVQISRINLRPLQPNVDMTENMEIPIARHGSCINRPTRSTNVFRMINSGQMPGRPLIIVKRRTINKWKQFDEREPPEGELRTPNTEIKLLIKNIVSIFEYIIFILSTLLCLLRRVHVNRQPTTWLRSS